MEALRDVSFSVADGEFVSLLGPSGCGKSTALRIAAGLLAPDAGTVTRERPDIGFVFQEPTLMPWADALANARLPLDLKGMARSEANDRAAAALARVGLTGFERAYPARIVGRHEDAGVAGPRAGGPAKAAAAGRALRRPGRDHPQPLGDDLLRLWREDGLTVLFVTHSVSESAFLSQRVLVMTPRPGAITADLALPTVRDNRLSPATIEAQRAISSVLNTAMAA